MHNYSFPLTPRLRALAKHAIENHRWQKVPYTGPECGLDLPLEKPKKPALAIVKDQGAYIMSTSTLEGAPIAARLFEPDPKKPGEDRLVVVYADGHDPEKDEDYWEGGDDFVEQLEGLPELILRCPESLSAEVNVKITSRTINFRIVRALATPPRR